MKLHILSDIHNEFSVFKPEETDADVIVLAGDIDVKLRAFEWAKSFNKPVIYVAGNHEFYGTQIEEVKAKARQLSHQNNIYFLDDDEFIHDNVRFLGATLWTNFSIFGEGRQVLAMLDAKFNMNDYRLIRIGASYRKFDPKNSLALHQKSVEFLKNKLNEHFLGKTVVITHMAPSLKSVHGRYLNDALTPAYASNLEHLMGDKIDLWIHGHVHHSNDYTINGTRIVSNPRGYQGELDRRSENDTFNPKLVIAL